MSSFVDSLVRFRGLIMSTDDVPIVIPPPTTQSTVSATQSTVPALPGAKSGVRRSKSSSRFTSLDPVLEHSSEESSMDSRRDSLPKSMSSESIPLLPPKPPSKGKKKAVIVPLKGEKPEGSKPKSEKKPFAVRIWQRLSLRKRGGKEDAVYESDSAPKKNGILKKEGSLKRIKRAVSFHLRIVTRTISSDGAGLLEPISSQTKAFSCQSINSNGNTDESDGPLRIRTDRDDGLGRDPRTVSKHKYFAPNGDRNFISKYITPTFHERSRSFRKLFHALVPEDEQMLASFSCAYQREILVQGRIFISSRHFCFYANIFGWGTIFAIPMIDVTDITEEKTLLMFPNSIQLSTEVRGRVFFASFTNRDKTIKVMRHAWEQIRAGGKGLTPDQLWDLMNPAVSAEKKEKEKEKEKPEKRSSKRKKNSVSVSSADETAMLKSSSSPNLDPAERAAAGACTVDDFDAAERSSSSSTTTDISMTAECICNDHRGKKLLDQVFPRSPSELFELMFTASPWHAQLASHLKHTAHAKMPQKHTDYISSDWATNKQGVRQRTCTYTLALNNAMAPKSCTVTESQVYKEFPGGFTIFKESRNSGVPYSESFHISCSYCVMGYGRGQARLVVHGGLVFTKSVWGVIKAYIEKSTVDGLAEHYEALLVALNGECKRSGAGTDGLALDDDPNRMDTSSEEGVEAEADTGNGRGMTGSISAINFVRNGTRGQQEPCYDLPLLGRVRRIDFYGVGIMTLLALMSLTLIILVTRLPSQSTPESRLLEAVARYARSDSVPRPPTEAVRPDLDALIAAIGKIGAQLQQVRDNGQHGEF